MDIPQKQLDLIGTTRRFGGGLFSAWVDLPETEYKILKVRWGLAKIVDVETRQSKHPTVEYLLKNPLMKKAKWSRPFACLEINLSENSIPL